MPSHIAMTSDRRRDSLMQRAAESLRKPERAERLGIALADLARELADARRQISALKRENAALRAQLAQRRGEEVTPLRPQNRFQPGMGVSGPRGG
jgi:septal ring factor EnvC (AmiA/AmiB activator)